MSILAFIIVSLESNGSVRHRRLNAINVRAAGILAQQLLGRTGIVLDVIPLHP